MGLSRNKVAVSEGAAGSPPFYGERAISLTALLRILSKENNDLTRLVKWSVVQFSRINEFLKKSVLQTQRVHLFPFRTQKLSSAVVKILYGRLYGKIAQCRHSERAEKSALCTAKTKCANHTLTTKDHSSAG